MRRFYISSLFIVTAFVFAVPFSSAATPPERGLQGAQTQLQEAGGSKGAGFKTTNLEDIIGGLIKALLSLLGIIFVALLIYGGFIWMRATGNEQEVEKATNIIKNAVIGIIIVVLAYAITFFILARLKAATGAPL